MHQMPTWHNVMVERFGKAPKKEEREVTSERFREVEQHGKLHSITSHSWQRGIKAASVRVDNDTTTHFLDEVVELLGKDRDGVRENGPEVCLALSDEVQLLLNSTPHPAYVRACVRWEPA